MTDRHEFDPNRFTGQVVASAWKSLIEWTTDKENNDDNPRRDP